MTSIPSSPTVLPRAAPPRYPAPPHLAGPPYPVFVGLNAPAVLPNPHVARPHQAIAGMNAPIRHPAPHLARPPYPGFVGLNAAHIEGWDSTIMPGREFSDTYTDLSIWQEPLCHLCRAGNPVPIPGGMFTMYIPEDLCIKCLLLIAKQTKDLWIDNNSLFSRIGDIERV